MASDEYKLEDLEPFFKSKVRKLIIELESDGYSIRVVWGKRTKEENDRLHKKGHASRNSKHLEGLAVDLINRRIGYSENPQEPYYLKLEELAEKYNLRWGGHFKHRWDPNHIEEPSCSSYFQRQ
jgi:hypothetical protein